MNFFHSNGFANLCLAVAFLCMDNSWSPMRIKKEGCLTESLFLFCQIIIDNQFTQTLIHAVQNQLLSRCVVTRTSPVVVTSSVVVSSMKITLAHGALGIVLRLPDGERALYATPCGGRGAVRHLRRCECYRCRLFRVEPCNVIASCGTCNSRWV